MAPTVARPDYRWSVSTRYRRVRYQLELHHIITPNQRDVRKLITAQIYISANRWLLFKQTQPCCLNTMLHVRRSGRQDDSAGQDKRCRVGKDGICHSPSSSRSYLHRSFCSVCKWFSIQPFGHTIITIIATQERRLGRSPVAAWPKLRFCHQCRNLTSRQKQDDNIINITSAEK